MRPITYETNSGVIDLLMAGMIFAMIVPTVDEVRGLHVIAGGVAAEVLVGKLRSHNIFR